MSHKLNLVNLEILTLLLLSRLFFGQLVFRVSTCFALATSGDFLHTIVFFADLPLTLLLMDIKSGCNDCDSSSKFLSLVGVVVIWRHIFTVCHGIEKFAARVTKNRPITIGLCGIGRTPGVPGN